MLCRNTSFLSGSKALSAFFASMVEWADTPVLGAGASGFSGSNPDARTKEAGGLQNKIKNRW